MNDSVTTYDCSLVLQHNIAKKFLNGLQQFFPNSGIRM
jgi:hypothetical protein